MATPTTAVKSFSERAMENNLPVLVDRDFIADLGPVIWTGATPAEARNPQNGEVGPGLLAQLSTDEGRNYQSFIGNVALLQILSTYDEDSNTYIPRDGMFPFRARLVKSGRTWVFAD